MTDKEKEQIKSIRLHLASLHEKWQNDPDRDGHCKSNEGYVGVTAVYPNWFEAESDKQEYIATKPKYMVEVYSYLFGPSRLHTFDSIDKAYTEIMRWEY